MPHEYPPPWEALGDLLHFGGREGFRLPPRAGSVARWPPRERELLDLLLACVRADAATARRSLPVLDADGAVGTSAADAADGAAGACEVADSWLTDAWWAGAAAFLHARLERLALLDELPAAGRAPLLAEERVCRRRHAHALQHVPALLQRLERAGLRPILLKGLVYAVWLYPEPWTRPCGDVDLLLAVDEAVQAERLLLAEGFVRTPLHDPRVDVRSDIGRGTGRGIGRGDTGAAGHRHGAPLARRVDDRLLIVELHTALADRAAPARLGIEELLARSERMPIGGRELRVLQPDDRLAHIGLHHPAELSCRRLLDVLLVARRVGASGLARARRLLDPADRWQLDLLALCAARLLDPALADAVPAWRRSLLSVACTPEWPSAHLSALRARREDGLQGGRVRRPLRAAADRVDLLGRAGLPVLGREPRRRVLAALRLVRDLARAAAGRGLRE